MKTLPACIAAIAFLASPAMAGEAGPVPDAVREVFGENEWRKDTERYDGMTDPPKDDAESAAPGEEKE